MTEAYRDVVWSPPIRQREILPSSVGRGLVPAPVKWSPPPGGMMHPAVFPSFKTPESPSRVSSADLPPGAYLMTVNKPSLFFLGFSLMLLGVCFFSSGLFLGMWIGGKSAGEVASAQIAETGGQAGGGSGGGGAAGGGRFGTLLGFAGTAVGGKAGRVAFAGQRAMDRDRKQQAHAGGGGSGASGGRGQAPQQGISGHEISGHEPGLEGEDFEGDNSSAPLPGTTYAVQLGSFAAKENAQDLISHLKSDSFSAYLVESKDSDGGPVFCVRAGEYRRFEIAASAALAISDQKQLSAIAVGVKPTDKRLMQ